jgi:hypothetical protein
MAMRAMSRAVEYWPGTVRPWAFLKLLFVQPSERALAVIFAAKALVLPALSRASTLATSLQLLMRKA